MAQAVRRDRWDHTATILCQTANLNRGNKPAFDISKFHPFAQQASQVVRGSIQDLKILLQNPPKG